VRYYYISRKHVKSKWPKRNDIIVSLFGYDLNTKRALDAPKKLDLVGVALRLFVDQRLRHGDWGISDASERHIY
jgi:hypothetical protein